MLAKSVVVAIGLLSTSFAFAASPVIGTVSTRGEISVGGYPVKGTATLFENTAVETSAFSAVMRLDKGTEIKLGSGSSGTLFHDRLVLSHGETQLVATNSFKLEASGLFVSSSAPNTSGIVAVGPQNTVEVVATTGDLKVMNSQGLLLAHVTPGASLSFAVDHNAQDQTAPQPPPSVPGAQPVPPPASPAFADVGMETQENGHYYMNSSQSGMKYEITGNGLSRFVNAKVVINGKLVGGTLDAPTMVQVNAIAINGGEKGMSKKDKALIYLAIGGAAAGIAYAVASSSR